MIYADTVTFNADTVCFGNITHFSAITDIPATDIEEYQWDFEDSLKYNITTTSPNATFIYSRAATHKASVRIKKIGVANPVTMAQSKNVIVNPVPEVNFVVDVPCQNSNTIVRSRSTTTGNSNYSWEIDNKVVNTSDTSFSYNFTKSSHTIKLTVSNAYQCFSLKSQTISFAQKPISAFNVKNVTCPGIINEFENQSSTINDTSTSYKWTFGDGNFTVNEINTKHEYINPGKYTVSLIVISNDNCTDTSSSEIDVQPGRELIVTYDKTVLYNNETTVLEANDGFTYEWSNGATTPSIIVSKGGQYILKATDEDGCISIDTIDITSYAEYDPNKITAINSVLTPNEDGYNDYLEFIDIEAHEEAELTIYNQWGIIVYFNDNYLNDFSGRDDNGKLLESGTYFYVIRTKKTSTKGSINILRPQ